MPKKFSQVWELVRAELAKHGYIYLDATDKRIAEGGFKDGLALTGIVSRCLRYIEGAEFSMGC